MILKANEEIKNSFNPYSALEMVAIRMAYVSDLPTPEEIINSVDTEGQNKKKKLTKKVTEEKVLNHKPGVIEQNLSTIKSFEDIIEIAGENKNLILKKFLQEDVRLVSFETGHININTPNGNEEIIKDLILKGLIKLSKTKSSPFLIEESQEEPSFISEIETKTTPTCLSSYLR